MKEIPLYLLEADLPPDAPVGDTGWAEDEDFDLEKAEKVAMAVYGLGHARLKQLDSLRAVDHRERYGAWIIKYTSTYRDADFVDQSNANYLKKQYPWLHSVDSGSLGIDEDDAKKEAGDVERFLAKIDEGDWDSFVSDMESLDGYPLLDEDGHSQLEMEEQSRWMREDGVKDFRKALIKHCDDSFTAFVMEYVSESMAWDWCRETDNYPEIEGTSAWMNFEEKVDEDDVAWAMDQFKNLTGFQKKWKRLKREYYEAHKIDELLDRMIRKNMLGDPVIAHDYQLMTAEDLYAFFLRLVPDGAYDTDRPHWWMTKPNWNSPLEISILTGLEGLSGALDELTQQPEAFDILKRTAHHEPLEHPELPLGEAVEPSDPDEANFDPEAWFNMGGYLRSKPLYADDNIEIIRVDDKEAWERLMGTSYTVVNRSAGWYYDFPVVILDSRTRKPIATYDIEGGEVKPINAVGVPYFPVDKLLKSQYGKSVRRGMGKILRSWWKEHTENDEEDEAAKVLPLLHTFGGYNAVKRAMARKRSGYPGDTYDYMLKDYGTYFGMSALRHMGNNRRWNIKRAAEYLQRPIEDFDKRGVWLYWHEWSDFAPLFKYEEGAEEVLSGEAWDWFSYLWEQHIDLKDAWEWLDADGRKAIRDLMVNREVYFPDDGWVVVTRQMLNDYTDDDLWQWVLDPDDEEVDNGTYDDIREALEDGARRMLEAAGRDQLEETWRGLVQRQLDVIESKFVDDPHKKGSDRLALLIPYGTLLEAYDWHVEQEGANYGDNLEDMLMSRYKGDIDTERTETGADWPRVGDSSESYYREMCSEPLMELPMLKLPEDPNQMQLPIKEGLDDPPDDLLGWIDEPPGHSVQALTPIVQKAGETAGVDPFNIRMSYNRRNMYFHIDFDVPQYALHVRPLLLDMLRTLDSHVINVMAQYGYEALSGWLIQPAAEAAPNHVTLSWGLERLEQ